MLACSRLHWSERSDRTRPRTCVGRRKAINPVSVITVLRTSSEQDPVERHNHKLLAEHCDTRNCHLRRNVLHACRNLLEPLCLFTVSSVLAAFIMAVFASERLRCFAKRLGSAWYSCMSCARRRCVLYLVLWRKKVVHRVTIGIHW